MGQPRQNAHGPIQPTLFPTFQPFEPVQFRLSSKASGEAGAEARLSTSLNNAPQILYRVSFSVSYELPADFFSTHLDFKRQMRDGGIDDDFEVDIRLTQQNITEGFVHVRDIQGFQHINIHPLPVPYAFQGGNNLTVVARRLTSYPVVDGVEIVPTLSGALQIGMFVSDTGGTAWTAAP